MEGIKKNYIFMLVKIYIHIKNMQYIQKRGRVEVEISRNPSPTKL
jgi:hypothetical protein